MIDPKIAELTGDHDYTDRASGNTTRLICRLLDKFLEPADNHIVLVMPNHRMATWAFDQVADSLSFFMRSFDEITFNKTLER